MGVGNLIKDMADELDVGDATNELMYRHTTIQAGTIVWGIISLLMGFTFIFLTLNIALEVMYLNLPAFQDRVSILKSKSEDGTATVLGFMMRDAELAIKVASMYETGRSYNLEYLRIKTKTVLTAFIILGLLIGGGPKVAVKIVFKVVSAIIYVARDIVSLK